MAETIGTLIVTALAAEAAVASTATALSVSVAAVNTAIGTIAITAASIGLQYALRPGVPKPADGSQPIKQAVPPRQRGYGRNRMSGYYMLFEQLNKRAFRVSAFHQGRIGGVVGHFLNDDPVVVSGGVVQNTYADRYFEDSVRIEVGLGNGANGDYFIDGSINSYFHSSTHPANDIAWFSTWCGPTDNPEEFTKKFPFGMPNPSVIADLAPVFDPRDASQNRANPLSWKVSYNPVIQLMDYLTCEDGGMGHDFSLLFPTARLAQWVAQANLCDEHVLISGTSGATEPRYRCSGWYTFDTKPQDVINSILATCDGWMADAGDGTQALHVGVYTTPTIAPITEKDIIGFSLNYGQSDETTVNIIQPKFTDPNSKYVEVQTDPIMDFEAIALTGDRRPQPLDLKWVQSNPQAQRLGYRALQRVAPKMSGTFTTTLAGLRYVGLRWVPLAYPFVSGLQDCVVENLGADIDLLGGKIVFSFARVAPDKIEAYDPNVNEGRQPPIPPSLGGSAFLLTQENVPMMSEDNTYLVEEY